MAISSGDMVLISESNRFVNNQGHVATQLFDLVSDRIYDFETMKQAIKEAYSSDPSLSSLIREGSISNKGWFALFENEKVQRVIAENTKKIDNPEFLNSIARSESRINKEYKRKAYEIKQKNKESVSKFLIENPDFQKKSSWSGEEDMFLKRNKNFSLGALFLAYEGAFGKKRSISAFKDRINKISKK